MSFKEFDQQTFIIDTANAISPAGRFPSASSCARWAWPAIGFSAFDPGMLGNPRGLRDGSLLGTEAYADGCRTTRPNG